MIAGLVDEVAPMLDATAVMGPLNLSRNSQVH
jgi:hypothetical protein